MNNIYGGVHGRQREGMLKKIDKSLGIDKFENNSRLNRSMNLPENHSYENYS